MGKKPLVPLVRWLGVPQSLPDEVVKREKYLVFARNQIRIHQLSRD
jgi:hypothetical protein